MTVDGRGGPLTCTIRGAAWRHHRAGFSDRPVVYTPDVSEMSEAGWGALQGVDCWITDALRYRPHPSHANVETALEWIDPREPPRAILTNLHVDLDYATLDRETPGACDPGP